MLDMARCMLKHKNFPKSLWGETVITIAYILNRCPTKKLKNKVPEEVCCGKRPSVSHLEVFGSICYKHVSDVKRMMLDDKSEPMILVGYHKIGAHRLFNSINEKILMSRDIMIDENYAWDLNSSEAINKPLMGYGVDEETNEVEVEDVAEILDIVDIEANSQEGVVGMSQRPKRTRVLPSRL